MAAFVAALKRERESMAKKPETVHMVLDDTRFVCGMKKGKFDSVLTRITCGRCLKLLNKVTPIITRGAERVQLKYVAPMPEVAPAELVETACESNEEVVGTRVDVSSGKKIRTAKQVKKVVPVRKEDPPKKAVTTVARKKKKAKEPKPCKCGCKIDGKPAMTKGGDFIPGHDARYYSALKKAGIVTGHGKH